MYLLIIYNTIPIVEVCQLQTVYNGSITDVIRSTLVFFKKSCDVNTHSKREPQHDFSSNIKHMYLWVNRTKFIIGITAYYINLKLSIGNYKVLLLRSYPNISSKMASILKHIHLYNIIHFNIGSKRTSN